MKRIVSFFLSLVLIIVCFCVKVNADSSAVIYIAGENADSKIILPQGVPDNIIYAAETLQKYLMQISGQSVPIVSSNDGSTQIIIRNDSSLPEGAYIIKTDDISLTITGGGKRGAIYGVFAFLERVCDCRYYTEKEFFIPQKNTVSIPVNYVFEYTPFFEYTETDWNSRGKVEFTVANNISGGNLCNVPEIMGGCIKYISDYCHTLTTQFCSATTYFEKNPECFAIHNGTRTPNQLCLTNPTTVRIVTEEVLSLLGNRYDPQQALQIVSVTQHDNRDYCMCSDCKAIDDSNHSHAGTMVAFANKIAEAVESAGYNNVFIDTFAYQYTRKAPTKVVPRKNVIIRLCSIECCFGHTLDNPNCKENNEFMQDLYNWSEICNRIYIWDYCINFSEYLSFFPNFNTMQRNMQLFYENNVKGIFGEGNAETHICDGEFSDLRLYLQVKLMQNPYLDFEEELIGFLKFYYGNGWKHIKEFIDICTEKGVTKKKHAYNYSRANGSLPGIKSSDIKNIDSLWVKAEEKAEFAEQKSHVYQSELCWRYWKCANRKGEFSLLHTPYQCMKVRDELFLDLKDAGITTFGETYRKRTLSSCYALHLVRNPFCWTVLYENRFWDFISPSIVFVYRVMDKLHSKML